jgi:hypothetical protein
MRGIAVATIVASIAAMKVASMSEATTSGRRVRGVREGMALFQEEDEFDGIGAGLAIWRQILIAQ